MFSPASNERTASSGKVVGAETKADTENHSSPTSVLEIPSTITTAESPTRTSPLLNLPDPSQFASTPLKGKRCPSSISKQSVVSIESGLTSTFSEESSWYTHTISTFGTPVEEELDTVARELFVATMREPHWTMNAIQEEVQNIEKTALATCFLCGTRSDGVLTENDTAEKQHANEEEITTTMNNLSSALIDEEDERMDRLMTYTKGEAVLKLDQDAGDGKVSLEWVLSAENSDAEGKVADFHYEEQKIRTYTETLSADSALEEESVAASEGTRSTVPLPTPSGMLSSELIPTAKANTGGTKKKKKKSKMKWFKTIWKSPKKTTVDDDGFEI